MTTTAAVEFDPFSAEYFDDPTEVYRRLRDEAPVYFSERYGFYALSRFEDVVQAHRDWQGFSSAHGVDLSTLTKDPNLIRSLGMLIMTCAFVSMILASGIIALVVFTLLFSLSELLVAPCLDAAADSLAGPRRRATYLGFVSVGWAVGAVVGNSIGVQTFSSGSPSWHHSVSWFSFTLTAAAGALAFGAMRRGYRRRQPSAAARVPDIAPESPRPVPGGRPE